MSSKRKNRKTRNGGKKRYKTECPRVEDIRKKSSSGNRMIRKTKEERCETRIRKTPIILARGRQKLKYKAFCVLVSKSKTNPLVDYSIVLKYSIHSGVSYL